MSNDRNEKEEELMDLLKDKGHDDEELEITLTALLTSAIHDTAPQYTLAQIASTLTRSGLTGRIDALHAIPLLLDSSDESVDEILALLGECGSGKEIVIATQESVERIIAHLEIEDPIHELKAPLHVQLHRAMSLYISSIPRLKQRKKSPSSTLRPIFSDISTAISKISASLTSDIGLQLFRDASRIVESVTVWSSKEDSQKDDEEMTKALCKGFLFDITIHLSNFLDSSKAQRVFQSKYPRLSMSTTIKSGWEDAEQCVVECITVLDKLGYTADRLLKENSITSLIFIAHHSSLSHTSPINVLETLLPPLTTSIQSNTALSSSLSILLICLYVLQSGHSDISPELAIHFSSLLISLSSLHPDPQTRHLAYRILSLLLSVTPPLTRMQILKEALTDEIYPQIRVAGVGLLKESILEALSSQKSGNPFASPALLQTFGPIVFRPNPPELFAKSNLQLDGFLDSVEPRRLIECLSLYYVLLNRDQKNATGIRDRDNFSRVSEDLLRPLNEALERWSDEFKSDGESIDQHALMPLNALDTALERVNEAKARLEQNIPR